MSDEDPKQPRRRFLNVAIGGTGVAFGATVLYPVARFVEPGARPPSGTVRVGKVTDFPIGAAKTVLVDDRPVIVVRAADGAMRAFLAICSHLQCVVAWVPERSQFECPCHKGVYSADGLNIGGPPPRPLEELVVTQSDGDVLVGRA